MDQVLGNWSAGTPPMGMSGKVPEPASEVLFGLSIADVLLRPHTGKSEQKVAGGVPESHPGVGE